VSDHQITTLSEFLKHSGARYRIFDMARRVAKISNEDFIDIEKTNQPYPYPLQKTAHFGIVFWNPDLADKHYVWFLKFPLDEQGLMIQAARDEFLVMLLDRVGECMLAANEGEQIEGALKDSPYTFKPRDDKMAAFNAQASVSLAVKPSKYYEPALAYFTGQTAAEDWPMLGMQGVADIAIRLSDKQTVSAVAKNMANVPEQPFITFSAFLEHAEPTIVLVESLFQKLKSLLEEEQANIALVSACLRAVSNSPATGLVDQMVMQVLNHKEVGQNIEVLATMSGRLWRILEQADLCQLFVERLAENNAGSSGFSQVLADAMYMPGLRNPIMTALRSPARSQALSLRVGELFGQPSA
jgi:hypothetical protein